MRYILSRLVLITIVAFFHSCSEKSCYEFYSTGQLYKKYDCIDGVKFGLYEEFYISGALKVKANFEKGNFFGEKIHYLENGKVDSLKYYSYGGELDSMYFITTKKKYFWNFQNGQRIEYYSNGVKKDECFYVKGKKDGKFTYFDPTGAKKVYGYYNMGNLLYKLNYSNDSVSYDEGLLINLTNRKKEPIRNLGDTLLDKIETIYSDTYDSVFINVHVEVDSKIVLVDSLKIASGEDRVFELVLNKKGNFLLRYDMYFRSSGILETKNSDLLRNVHLADEFRTIKK